MVMWLTAKPIQQLYSFPPTTLPKRRSSSTATTSFNTKTKTKFRIVLNNKNNASSYPPVVKKKSRYRKLYPGETTGITEEMRFVAMRLRNDKATTAPSISKDNNDEETLDTWHPSMKGFVKFLVDNNHVFTTLERIVDDSENVSYAYFRKTGLERSEGLLKDLEWLKEEGIEIPGPSNPGVSYAKYLEELAERSAPLFLSHFYNIHFSHIAAGQVITKQVCEKLLEGKELEFYRWEGDVQELLKDVREKLDVLAEHWTRDEKNKCLRETKKSFQFMGQIVRLIIS